MFPAQRPARTGIASGWLTGGAAEEQRAAGRAVADGVADHARQQFPGIAGGHDDGAAAHAFGNAVLRGAVHLQVEAVDAPGAEALAGVAGEAQSHRLTRWQS